MAKINATEAMNKEFRVALASWEERYSLDRITAAKYMGFKCIKPYSDRRENPGLFTVDQFRLFIKMGNWTDEQILKMVRPE